MNKELSLRALFAKQSRKYLWIAAPYKKHKARNDEINESGYYAQ